MRITQVYEKDEKQKITRQVLEALEDWFGIPEAHKYHSVRAHENMRPF